MSNEVGVVTETNESSESDCRRVQYEVTESRGCEIQSSHENDAGFDAKLPGWSSFEDVAEDVELLPTIDHSQPGVNQLFSEESEDLIEPGESLEFIHQYEVEESHGLVHKADGFFFIAVPPGKGISVDLHLKFYLPEDLFLTVDERSSTAMKRGLTATGRIIDPGYRGTVHAMLWNVSDSCKVIEQRDRLVQLVPRIREKLQFELRDSKGRSTDGLGSTGEK